MYLPPSYEHHVHGFLFDARAAALAAGSPSAVGQPAASGASPGPGGFGEVAEQVQAAPTSDLLARVEEAAADIRRRLDEADPPGCSQCGADKADRVGLSFLDDGQHEADDYGFCSVEHLRDFVHERWPL